MCHWNTIMSYPRDNGCDTGESRTFFNVLVREGCILEYRPVQECQSSRPSLEGEMRTWVKAWKEEAQRLRVQRENKINVGADQV